MYATRYVDLMDFPILLKWKPRPPFVVLAMDNLLVSLSLSFSFLASLEGLFIVFSNEN